MQALSCHTCISQGMGVPAGKVFPSQQHLLSTASQVSPAPHRNCSGTGGGLPPVQSGVLHKTSSSLRPATLLPPEQKQLLGRGVTGGVLAHSPSGLDP